MAGVYSTRFLSALHLNGSVIYVVPAGQVAVVRDVIMTLSSTGSGSTASISIGGVATLYEWLPPSAGSISEHLECRVVVHAGESLYFSYSGPGVMDGAVSGYLLST